MSRSFYVQPAVDPTAITTGESTVPRLTAASALGMSSQALRLVYFTAQKTETVNSLRLYSGTAAGATPTLVRAGLYTIAANGNLTLAASIANDTTLFAAANTGYTRALTAPFAKVAGTRYAIGILVVTSASAPTVPAATTNQAAAQILPVLCQNASGSHTDLPASITTFTVLSQASYVELLP